MTGLPTLTLWQPWASLVAAGVKTKPPWWDRFWSKVDLSDLDGCWPWQAANDRGYGQFKLGGKTAKAYRVAYELLIGPIPEGLAIDHVVCGNPPCVNPAHMEVVTRGENAARARRAQTHCRRSGHPLTPDNIHVTTQGWRVCLSCKRERQALRRAKGLR